MGEWREGDRYTNGANVWRVQSVTADGERAVLQSESTAWAHTMPVTMEEWEEAAPAFRRICRTCDGTRVICVAPGGNPDAAEDQPCPECGDVTEENPRERGEDDGQEYGDPRDPEGNRS